MPDSEDESVALTEPQVKALQALRVDEDRACCRRAALRGFYLGCGTMSDPARGYHLEFTPPTKGLAQQVMRLLESEGVRCGMSARRGQELVYVKDAESISDLLGMMGASGAMLEFENSRVVRGLAGSINRVCNFEASNLIRTTDAANRVAEDIAYLEEQGILETLPESLRETARLREENPDLSIAELGEMCDPPVSKSGINHRLRRLSELAQRDRASR